MGILLFIAVPSLSLLYALEELEGAAALVIQVVGRQWYWVYEYPSFAANLLEVEPLETEAELRDPLNRDYPRLGLRLLDSTPLLLPLALEVEFLTASEDVIHSFALPSAGLKLDAVPGRLNQALSTLLRPGILYGQCSELCGSGHGFMPITAQVMVEPLFQLNMLEKADLLQDYLQSWLQDAAPAAAESVVTAAEEPLSEEDIRSIDAAVAELHRLEAAGLLQEYLQSWLDMEDAPAAAESAAAAAASEPAAADNAAAAAAAAGEAGAPQPSGLPYQWPLELLEVIRPYALLEPNMGPLQRNVAWELPQGVALRSAPSGGFWLELLQLVPLQDYPGGFGPLLHRVFVEGEESAASLQLGLEQLQRAADAALQRTEAGCPTLAELLSAFFYSHAGQLPPLELLQHPYPPQGWPLRVLQYLRIVSETAEMGEPRRLSWDGLGADGLLVRSGPNGFWVEMIMMVPLQDFPGCSAPVLTRVFLEGDENTDMLEALRQLFSQMLAWRDPATPHTLAEALATFGEKLLPLPMGPDVCPVFPDSSAGPDQLPASPDQPSSSDQQ